MRGEGVKYTGCIVSKIKMNKSKPYAVILTGYSSGGRTPKRKQAHIGTFKTKREAEAERARQITAMEASTFVPPSDILVKDYLEYWIKEYVSGGKYKIRTVEAYDSVVRNHFIPFLGHISLQDLSERDIERYFATKRRDEDRVSEGTLQQHYAIIHKALKVATNSLRLLSVNPAERVEGKPRGKQNSKVTDTWSREEVERVIATADKMGARQSAFYHMALETGMRKGELCGLHWGDISLVPGAGEIIVRGQLVKAGPNWSIGTPKNGRERRLPISEELVERLIRWRSEQDIIRSVTDSYEDHDFVFTSIDGSPLLMNNLGQREYAKLVKASGVRRIRFHDMRHTNASLLIEAGTEVKLVSERLGHSSTAITMDIYCHTSASAHRAVANSMWRKKYKKDDISVVEAIYQYGEDNKEVVQTYKH